MQVSRRGRLEPFVACAANLQPPPTTLLQRLHPRCLLLSPAAQTATYFGTTASTTSTRSIWGTGSTHASSPEGGRALTFWGSWPNAPCNASPWNYTIANHEFSTPAGTVISAFQPQCGDSAQSGGPSIEADVITDGGDRLHLIRTTADSRGPFAPFGPDGQPPSSANKHIAASYVAFNPPWRNTVANRTRPWGAGAGDRLRMAIRCNQSVAAVELPESAQQQLQQVVTVTLVNEDCDPASSSTFGQIELNLKTFLSGVHAKNPDSDATAFNDGGQGGLLSIVGPINGKGQVTMLAARGKRVEAYTSWGSPTQNSTFESTTFQVEVLWSHWLHLLDAVTDGDPAATFGQKWDVPNSWVLLRAGYGQENYNPVPASQSTIEGYFYSLEVISTAA